ncbi:hypothetical protein WN48_03718 [Eufriesea mexicana]|nr:hypothetical protein WN48_03718 [Eufriesea mexicana]
MSYKCETAIHLVMGPGACIMFNHLSLKSIQSRPIGKISRIQTVNILLMISAILCASEICG